MAYSRHRRRSGTARPSAHDPRGTAGQTGTETPERAVTDQFGAALRTCETYSRPRVLVTKSNCMYGGWCADSMTDRSDVNFDDWIRCRMSASVSNSSM